jgi:hypothetical protein
MRGRRFLKEPGLLPNPSKPTCWRTPPNPRRQDGLKRKRSNRHPDAVFMPISGWFPAHHGAGIQQNPKKTKM